MGQLPVYSMYQGAVVSLVNMYIQEGNMVIFLILHGELCVGVVAVEV